jgi:glycosyltransferase involved in cell wall biosynthesis
MTRLRKNPEVLTVDLEGGGVLLDLETAAYYGLNRAGLDLWRHLELVQEWPVAGPWACFLEELSRQGLLLRCEDGCDDVPQMWSTPEQPDAIPSVTKHPEPLHGAASTLSDCHRFPTLPHGVRPMPFVTIIVPVRNAEPTITDCLTSLLALDFPDDRREIVVVDNGSTDRTSEIIQGFPVRVVQERRRGVSSARNRGIEVSQGDIIALTDADCVVTRTWLRELIGGFDSEEVGGVAGEIMAFPPASRAQRYMARRVPCWQRANLAAPQPSIVTASIAFRRVVFEHIGVFDPLLTRAQDTDFGWRFLQSGEWQLRYCPRAIVLHKHRATTAQFFLHQAKWGYGGAMIGAKYALPSRVEAELRSYGVLFRQLERLLKLCLAALWTQRSSEELEETCFEVLRQLGRRMGAMAWLIAGPRFRRAASTLGDLQQRGHV